MSKVIIYSTDFCGYCVRAKQLLERKGVAFEEIKVDRDHAQRVRMEQLSGRRTVPQIFIGEHFVGGYQDLYTLDRQGELDALLESVR